MGLWYTNSQCEDGGGVDVANDLTSKGEVAKLDTACCSIEALVSCHYKDKPSVPACKDSKNAVNIDSKGNPFW